MSCFLICGLTAAFFRHTKHKVHVIQLDGQKEERKNQDRQWKAKVGIILSGNVGTAT